MQPVPQNGTVAFNLTFDAPTEPGVYTSEWQMSYKANEYGARVLFTVVVLSKEQQNPGDRLSAFFRKAWEHT